MGFFGGNISRMRQHDYEQWVKERLLKLAKFSSEELEHIHEVSKVSKDEIMSVLEIIVDPELDYPEKVKLLDDEPMALRVLIVFATMDRQMSE